MPGNRPFDRGKHHSWLVSLSEAIRRGRLNIVLGPGVSIHAGLPTLTELLEPLRQELHLSGTGPSIVSGTVDCFSVAQIFASRFGRDTLVSRIVRGLGKPTQPSRIHKSLARLAPSNIFTINCDTLLETAFENAGKPYRVITRDAEEIDGPNDSVTLVTKLYGDISSPAEIVATRSDIFDYQVTRPKNFARFKKCLQYGETLFVGTSMRGANLEWLFDRVLQDLRGEGSKRYVLIEDWDESLRSYYGVYSLEPVPLHTWDEVLGFLEALHNMVAEQTGQYSSVDASPLLVSVQRYEEMVEEAAKGLEQEYMRLLGLFNNGAREAIRAPAEELWTRLECKADEKFRPLKIDALLLLARISLQTADQIDPEIAENYLKTARALAGSDQHEGLCTAEAILEYFKGEVAAALKILESLGNEAARKLSVGISMSSKPFDECERLIGAAAKPAGEDQEWDRIRAEFHVRRREYDTAAELMTKWLEGPDASLPSVELAARIHLHRAKDRHRRFCEEHNLFEHFSIVLMHEQLIVCEASRRAAGYFKKAAQKYLQLDENERAWESLEQAFGLLYDCRADAKELDGLFETLQAPKTAEHKTTLQALTQDESLAAMDLKDFDRLLRRQRNCLALLSRLKQWAILKGRPEEAADFLENQYVSGRFSSYAEQTAATYMLVELWHEVKRPELAFRAVQRLDFPKEFGFYPKILESAHYLFLEDQQAAERIVNGLLDDVLYQNNPVVLAMLCEYRGQQEAWEAMSDAAAKLFDIVKIPQTTDFYLTALGQLKRWITFLDVLSQAQSERVELNPLWTHINRSRALLALDRDQEARQVLAEARQLEREGKVTLGPDDRFHLVDAYVRTGDLSQALVEANRLVEDHRTYAPGHIGLVQLLLQLDRPSEAFNAAANASELFPSDDTVQALYIETGLLTGHGEQVSGKLESFHHRFPESKVLRLVPKEKAFQLYRETIEHARWAEEMYDKGKFPAVQAAYMTGSSPSYFRFWQIRTRSRRGVYLANGDQATDQEQLAQQIDQKNEAVFDFTALVTAYELDSLYPSWTRLLARTFSKLYVPDSFRRLLLAERTSLSGRVQLGRYEAMKRLRNMLDSPGSPFRPILTPGEVKDYMGPDKEREFAQQQDIYYLNEHSDERERTDKEFGLQQLGDHLSLEGDLSRRQQKRLDRLAATKRGCPLPRDKAAVRRIVANMMTLLTLEEAGLLKQVARHFDEIYFSDLGKQWLISDIGRFQFTEETASRFRGFEKYLTALGKKLEYVPVSGEQRKRVSPEYEDQIKPRDQFSEMSYFLDLFIVAEEKECCIVTDDRVTLSMHFSRDRREDFSRNTLRFGSDAVLRHLHGSGAVSSEEFAEIYDQLLEWRYLHMPPEPDYLLGLLPLPDVEASGRLDRAVGYYRDSLSAFIELAQKDRAVAQDVLQKTLNTYNSQLGSALRKAFDSGHSSDQAAHLVRGLAMNFFLDYFSARVPEYLTGLTPELICFKGHRMDERILETERKFQLWLDQALQIAGIRSEDIDLYWQAYLRHMIASKSYADDPSVWRELLGFACQILPEQRREIVALSNVGKELQDEGVWKITSFPAYEIRVPRGESTEVVAITEREMEEAAEQRLIAGIGQGVMEETKGRLRFSFDRKSSDSLFVHLNVKPIIEGVKDDEIPPIGQVISIMELLRHPEVGLREQAWETLRLRFSRSELDLKKWSELKNKLLHNDGKIWQPASQDSLHQLMDSGQVACEILAECLTESPSWFYRALCILKPEHVKHWLSYSGNELTHEHHLARTAWDDTVVDPQYWDGWKRIRDLAFHSMFADAEVARLRLVKRVFQEHGGHVRDILKVAHDLAHEGEQNPSPVYKVNVVMTVIEMANFTWTRVKDEKRTGLSQMEFWRSTADSDSSTELHQRVERLLTAACSPWSTLLDEPDEETEHLPIHSELSQAISKIWDSEAQDTNVQIRRFLSVIAGGFITAHFRTTGILSDVQSFRWFRGLLRGLRKWRPGVDRSPGFFRPYWWGHLEYHVCFAVKGLSRFMSTVAAYLMSDTLRSTLLETANGHKLACVAFGGAETLQPGVLDATLDTTDTAGVDRFLEQCAGNSIQYWSARDTGKLDALSKPVDLDQDLERLLRAIHEQTDESDSKLCILFMMKLELGRQSKRKGWDLWMARLLESPVKELIARSTELYEFLLEYAFLILLEPDVNKDVKSEFGDFIFSSPEFLYGASKLEAHFQVVLAMLRIDQHEQRTCKWIAQVAMAKSIDFRTRRNMIGQVTETFDNLPDDVKPTLRHVLTRLAHTPEWIITELLRFQEEPNGERSR